MPTSREYDLQFLDLRSGTCAARILRSQPSLESCLWLQLGDVTGEDLVTAKHQSGRETREQCY